MNNTVLVTDWQWMENESVGDRDERRRRPDGDASNQDDEPKTNQISPEDAPCKAKIVEHCRNPLFQKLPEIPFNRM